LDTINFQNIPNIIVARAVQELIHHFWPFGIQGTYETSSGWCVKLYRTPWISGGRDGLIARRLIGKLFSCLANQGYSFACSTKTAHALTSPVLFFYPNMPDPFAHYVVVSFSLTRRKVSIIDAPPALATDIVTVMRQTFPETCINGICHSARMPPWAFGTANTYADIGPDAGLVTIEFPRRLFLMLTAITDAAPGMARALVHNRKIFVGTLVRVINAHGFWLCASVPMDLSSMMGRREIWLFRSIVRAASMPVVPLVSSVAF